MTHVHVAGKDHTPFDPAPTHTAPLAGTATLHATIPPPPTEQDDETTCPCPNCDTPMHAIRGSKRAVCANCGFKDSCCF